MNFWPSHLSGWFGGDRRTVQRTTLRVSEAFPLSWVHAWLLGKQRPLLLNSIHDHPRATAFPWRLPTLLFYREPLKGSAGRWKDGLIHRTSRAFKRNKELCIIFKDSQETLPQGIQTVFPSTTASQGLLLIKVQVSRHSPHQVLSRAGLCPPGAPSQALNTWFSDVPSVCCEGGSSPRRPQTLPTALHLVSSLSSLAAEDRREMPNEMESKSMIFNQVPRGVLENAYGHRNHLRR